MNQVESLVGWLDKFVDILVAEVLSIAMVVRIGDCRGIGQRDGTVCVKMIGSYLRTDAALAPRIFLASERFSGEACDQLGLGLVPSILLEACVSLSGSMLNAQPEVLRKQLEQQQQG
jgi:hypothetical protein